MRSPIIIEHQLGEAPPPSPALLSSTYTAVYTDDKGAAWTLKVVYNPYGNAGEPNYSLWSSSGVEINAGFASSCLPRLVHLFVDDFQMWLAGALDKIQQLEAARVAAIENVHACPNCGDQRTETYASDSRQVVCKRCQFVYPRFSA